MDAKDLENRFRYHKPKDEYTANRHATIRTSCLELARIINTFVPESREKSLAITHLEEVMMWSNAGIARNNE